jgi:outer membrane receptor protein involved in Fe transport
VNLLNASVGWGSPDGALATRLWGMNLAGQRYQSFQDEEGNASQYSAAAPRTYGVTFTVHFGGARKP